MTKFSPILLIVFIFLCVSSEAEAQTDIALATKTTELRTLSENLGQRDEKDRREVQEFADRLGIPVRRELPNGKILELQRIAPGIGPIFYVTNNIIAADTVSTDNVWPNMTAGLSLNGSGMTVAEWDGGAIFADHPDFTGRLTQVDGATLVSGHSTHVAGTLVGSGDYLIDSRGMAYAAHLNAYDWNFDTSEMALAASNGLLLSNHSYGIAAGWIWLGGPPPDNWWWIGGSDPSDIEDPNFGYYDSETQLWDQIAFDAPYYLIVKASGNDRTEIGPSPGELYTVIDQDGNFLFTSTLPRNGDCAPAGYDCLPGASVAKNSLIVGAVDDLVDGYTRFTPPSAVQMADFSSWGPTDDGRIKPDVVGNGMFLFSAWPDDPYFALAAGTSMAAPNVTGSLLLLQEHYQDINGPGNFMRAATLKALAIHTADEAGDADGPDYEFGWGLLNTESAAQVITDNGGAHQIIEDSLADSTTDTVEIVVTDAIARISATLVWADPPGTVVAPTLDPPDLMLVNDLDLRIQNGASTHMPWILNPALPAAAATTGDNFRDNVEQVVIEGAGVGSYFVSVSHKGTLLSGANQNYSLIVTVKPTPPISSTILIDEDFSGGLPAGWSVVTIRGVAWTINSPIPGDDRLDNLTGGTGNFAIVDNDYSSNTIATLRTPAFDLTSATAVLLQFRNSFVFDFLESINVDVSTDGGTGWNNVWQTYGFYPGPFLKLLDLSGVAAGQNNVMMRFRFDSEGEIAGNYWQIDDVELEILGAGPPAGSPPGAASGPIPVDGAVDVSVNGDLNWTAGADTLTHDVYFNGVLQGNQPGTTFDPGTLAHSTTFNWRIDEVNADGTTAGPAWSFTTEAAPELPEFHIFDIDIVVVNVKGPRNRGVATVTVHDEFSAPLADVAVSGTFSGDSSGTSSGTTNGAGQAILQTPPVKNGSSWQLCVDTATMAGWNLDLASSASWLCDGPPPPPPPPPTVGSISGAVTEAVTGNPIQGASVNSDTSQSDSTDTNGNYTLSNVPTGTRTVTVSASGYDPAELQMPVTDGNTSTLDFVLTPTTSGGVGTLKGTVNSTSGAKLSGVTVQVVDGPSASTNKGGKYTVQNVDEGLQMVTASTAGFNNFTTSVTITAGATATLDIEMIPE